MLVEILFWVFASILVVSALAMIMVKNPVHAAMLLVLCFFTSASIWLLIEAEFLAVVLILVYVGAVMVLFLFVVMMLDINIEDMRARVTRYAVAGGIVAGVVVFEIVSVVWTRSLGTRRDQRCADAACRLQQYRRARQSALHGLRVSVRACGCAAAHRHCGGHLADHAQAPGTQATEHQRSRSRYARRSRAHRQGGRRAARSAGDRRPRRRSHDSSELAADAFRRAVRDLGRRHVHQPQESHPAC